MKLFIVLNVQGGVPSDPEVFIDRSMAIARYVERVKGWSELECLNEHKFPYPTTENFDSYFDSPGRCQECGEEVDTGQLGHTDDDLYFYDGIEVQDQQPIGTDVSGNPSETVNEGHLQVVLAKRETLEIQEARETVRVVGGMEES